MFLPFLLWDSVNNCLKALGVSFTSIIRAFYHRHISFYDFFLPFSNEYLLSWLNTSRLFEPPTEGAHASSISWLQIMSPSLRSLVALLHPTLQMNQHKMPKKKNHKQQQRHGLKEQPISKITWWALFIAVNKCNVSDNINSESSLTQQNGISLHMLQGSLPALVLEL